MAAIEMDADDEILRKLASGAAIDFSSWPVVLADIVARIEKAAHNDFPIPRIPQPKPASPLPEPRLLDPLPSSDPIDPSAETSSATAVANDESQEGPSSQETNKENTNPAPPASAAQTATTATLTSEPAADPTALPPQVVSLMNDITTTLTTSFPLYPPHTAQRLAELVLAPRQHYRSLPSYLHALDRVVHVTSGSNVFPLPPAVPDMSTMTLLSNGPARDGPWVNGTSSASSPVSSSTSLGNPPPINVGSDEALGGALLTPIPWLQRRAGSGSASGGSSSPPEPDPTQLAHQQQGQTAAGQGQGGQQGGSGNGGGQFEGQVHTETTETIEGPNGMGSIETVSISVNGIPSHGATLQLQRGVTQGELLRQEQRAGVVPVTQLARASMPATAGPMVGNNSNNGPASSNSNPSASAGNPAATAQTSEGSEEDVAMPDEDADPSATKGDEAPATSAESTGDDDTASRDQQQELPHARGPEEIGAADTGPQRESSSTFVTSPSGAVEMHGIDVAAAVGRNKADDTQQQQASSKKSTSPELGEERTDRASTPKREAEGGPDDATEPAAKRLKEDDAAGGEEGEGAKKDAEGDTVLADEDKDAGKEA